MPLRVISTGYDDATCMMWDTALEAPIDAFSPHADKITSLRVSGDGSALCSTSWDHTLKITAWNVSI